MNKGQSSKYAKQSKHATQQAAKIIAHMKKKHEKKQPPMESEQFLSFETNMKKKSKIFQFQRPTDYLSRLKRLLMSKDQILKQQQNMDFDITQQQLYNFIVEKINILKNSSIASPESNHWNCDQKKVIELQQIINNENEQLLQLRIYKKEAQDQINIQKQQIQSLQKQLAIILQEKQGLDILKIENQKLKAKIETSKQQICKIQHDTQQLRQCLKTHQQFSKTLQNKLEEQKQKASTLKKSIEQKQVAWKKKLVNYEKMNFQFHQKVEEIDMLRKNCLEKEKKNREKDQTIQELQKKIQDIQNASNCEPENQIEPQVMVDAKLYHELEERYSKVKQQCQQLKAELQWKTTQLQQISSKATSINIQQNKNQQRVLELEKQLQQKNDFYESKCQLLQKVTKQNDHIQQQLQNTKKNLNKQIEKVKQFEKLVLKRQQDMKIIQTQKQNLSKRIENLQQQIDSLQQTVKLYRQEIQVSVAKIGENSQQQTIQDKDSTHKANQIISLKQTIRLKDQYINDLQGLYGKLKKQLSNTEKQKNLLLAEIQTEKLNYKYQTDSLNKQINQLKMNNIQFLKQLEIPSEQLQNQLTSEQLKRNSQQKQQKIKELENQLLQKDQQITNIKIELQKLNMQIRQLQQKNRNLSQKLQVKIKQIAQQQIKINQLNQSQQQSKQQIEFLKRQQEKANEQQIVVNKQYPLVSDDQYSIEAGQNFQTGSSICRKPPSKDKLIETIEQLTAQLTEAYKRINHLSAENQAYSSKLSKQKNQSTKQQGKSYFSFFKK